ncbi:hypothetical protein XELAEV_18019984mg [Xenopus laevis]|uniref:Uncharacterized protein n=1 Tax=Xenopus laevis TaxID=8355 RepID=A0A974D8V7_XENLA|nr:hypothetical protein XELAEV_18019984mg [Xenopus laevis]
MKNKFNQPFQLEVWACFWLMRYPVPTRLLLRHNSAPTSAQLSSYFSSSRGVRLIQETQHGRQLSLQCPPDGGRAHPTTYLSLPESGDLVDGSPVTLAKTTTCAEGACKRSTWTR